MKATSIAFEQQYCDGSGRPVAMEAVAWSVRFSYPNWEQHRMWTNGAPRPEDVAYWAGQGRPIDLAYASAPAHPAHPKRPEIKFADPRALTVYSLLCDDTAPPEGEHWEGWTARRIVDALAQPVQPVEVPAGWKLVPEDPTDAMLDVAERLDWGDADVRGNCCNLWHVMFDASPTAPAPAPAKRPLFAARVAAQKWGELQADGARMQSLHFDLPNNMTGTINPWGVVRWDVASPAAPAPQAQVDEDDDGLTIAYMHGYSKGKEAAQVERKPLTQDQVKEAVWNVMRSDHPSAHGYDLAIARAIEAAHGITDAATKGSSHG